METIYFEVSIPKIICTKLLANFFPKIYYTPISPVRFSKLPDQPLPGSRWVRVKNIMAGICGADLSMFFVQASPSISLAALPGMPKAFLGHELVGRVVETGGEVKTLATGDRVVLQRYLPCCSMKEIEPPCEPCRQGNYTLCENFSEGYLPENLGAGFGDHFIAHESQVLKVPDQLPDESAVLIEPASVSLHAVLRRPPKPKENVLVIGAGVIGLNIIQFAKTIEPNCRLFLLEKIDFKKELGLRLGANEVLKGDTYDAVAKATGAHLYRGPLKNNNLLGGFDLVYDCVGYSKTIHDSLRWLKARGDYVMVGNQLFPVSFDQTPVWQQEVGIIGVNAHGSETFQGTQISSFDLAIKMILDGKINLNGFITHRFPLKKYRKAFKLFRDKKEKVIKVVFEME
ncbi:MAG: alcohol dehydrogenase catalytic domain-containing protein [Deltaproteobacteria bacterium]|nr:alcohol dehydrogenase catalytic domain-containing protein [Deltaproteobacteria bacterium]